MDTLTIIPVCDHNDYDTASLDDCTHEHVQQVSEHDVQCLDCGVISA